MTKKPNMTSVVLTAEAREAIAGSFRGFLKDGRYFNCSSVKERGSFVHLEVETPDLQTDQEVPFQITIPSHFVLYMLKASETVKEQLGFKAD